MKWKAPKVGDTRNKKKFAWTPITCKLQGSDEKQTRWLCFVCIHQRWAYEWLNEWFVD